MFACVRVRKGTHVIDIYANSKLSPVKFTTYLKYP